MTHGDEQDRVLEALRQLTQQHHERTDFAAEEVAEAADMEAAEAEGVLDRLVLAGRAESITAYWPDQGGQDLPPGGHLYRLLDAEA